MLPAVYGGIVHRCRGPIELLLTRLKRCDLSRNRILAFEPGSKAQIFAPIACQLVKVVEAHSFSPLLSVPAPSRLMPTADY